MVFLRKTGLGGCEGFCRTLIGLCRGFKVQGPGV